MPKQQTSRTGQDPLVTEFLQAMAADRGLAANSIAAYGQDLASCLESLSQAGRISTAAMRMTCEACWRNGSAAAARSVARRLSALRQMMVWLVEERVRPDNPCWIDNRNSRQHCRRACRKRRSPRDHRRPGPGAGCRSVADDGDARVAYATGLRVPNSYHCPWTSSSVSLKR